MATSTLVDRRVKRSQESLLNALHALMIERGYERLTIQHLLDRTGVGRATFYAHFENKEALLSQSLLRLRTWLEAEWRQAHPTRPMGYSLPFFQHVGSHHALYHRAVVPEHELTVERYLRAMLRDMVRADLQSRCATPARADGRLDLAVQFVANALWSTTVWWIDSRSVWPAEQVDRIFRALTIPGLAEVGLAVA